MFSRRLTLSGHPGITNEPLPLIAHTVPRGWRGRRFVDLGQQNRLNKKFTAMRRFFFHLGKRQIWQQNSPLSRRIDSSLRFCSETYIYNTATEKGWPCSHGCEWQSSRQKVQVQKKIQKEQQGPTRTTYWSGLLCQCFRRFPVFCMWPCLVWGTLPVGPCVFPSPLWGELRRHCSRMIRDICSCTCA